jgi:RNA polymerase sigma-70 factor (ECF subfamily)
LEDGIKRALYDKEAMSQLLDDLEPVVFRIAYHLTRHQQDAEDLAQEVLYKICTKLAQYRGDCSFHSWVYVMALNAYRDMYRKRKHDAQRDQMPLDLADPSFENDADWRIVLDQLLQELSETDRNIVILRFQNDLPVRQVAEIMKITEANVKTRVFRLKDKLKRMLLPGGEAL